MILAMKYINFVNALPFGFFVIKMYDFLVLLASPLGIHAVLPGGEKSKFQLLRNWHCFRLLKIASISGSDMSTITIQLP